MSKAWGVLFAGMGAFFGAEALAEAQDAEDSATDIVHLNAQTVTVLDELLRAEDSNARFLQGVTYQSFVDGPAGSEKVGGYFVFKLAPPSGADPHLSKQSLHTRATGILDGLGIFPDADPNIERNKLLGQLLCGKNHGDAGMRRNLKGVLKSEKPKHTVDPKYCHVVRGTNGITELDYDYNAHKKEYGRSKPLERMLVKRHGADHSPLWRRGTELYVPAWLTTYTAGLFRQAGIDPVSGDRLPQAGAAPVAPEPPQAVPPSLPSLEVAIYRLNPDNEEETLINSTLAGQGKLIGSNGIYTVHLPPGRYNFRNEKGDDRTVVRVESPSSSLDTDGDLTNNNVRLRLSQPEEGATPGEVVVISGPKEKTDDSPFARYTILLDTNAAEQAEQDALAATRRVIDGAPLIWIRAFGGRHRSDEQSDHPNGANLMSTASDATYGVFGQLLWFPGQTFDAETLRWLGFLVRAQFDKFAYSNGKLTGSQDLGETTRTFDFDFEGSDYHFFLQPGLQLQLNDPRVASFIHQLQLTYTFMRNGQTIGTSQEEDRSVLENEAVQTGHGVRLAYLPSLWVGNHVRFQFGLEGTVFPIYRNRQHAAPHQYGDVTLKDLSASGRLMLETLFAWRYAGVALGGELGGSRFTTRQRGQQDREGGNLSTHVRGLDYAVWAQLLSSPQPDFPGQFAVGYRLQGQEQDVTSSNPLHGTTAYGSTAHLITLDLKGL